MTENRPTVTADQVRELWFSGNRSASIDRGDDYGSVTMGSLEALAGQLDTDDEGNPLEDWWEIMAEQLNSDQPGEPTSSAGHILVQDIVELRRSANRAQQDADGVTEDLHRAIRAAMANKTIPRGAIAKASDLSRERLYQIRDGRR